jgi:hypothetical protein
MLIQVKFINIFVFNVMVLNVFNEIHFITYMFGEVSV